MRTKLTAVESRAQDAQFAAQCSWAGLRDKLPLHWPAPAGTPVCPKRRFRSQYVYLGCQDLADPGVRQYLCEFDLLLRLVDFTPLRPVLAQVLGWTSGRGWTPFDPLSLFLLLGWQLVNGWTRAKTLAHLADPRFRDYAQRLGFHDGIYPSEGGLRYFLSALGQPRPALDLAIPLPAELAQDAITVALHRLNYLLVQSVRLLVAPGFITPQAWQQALLCPDGMIHLAASRMRCTSVTETCYAPADATLPRTCAAQLKDRRGCDCDTSACAQVCRFAPPRDAQARCVWYAGSNQPKDNPNHSNRSDKPKPKGRLYYGYRSMPLQLADPHRRCSIMLLDHLQSAEAAEQLPATAELLALARLYPTLHVEAVAGDAGFGYERPLHTIYATLHARRVVDLRAHETDKHKALWPLRGYDDHGHPLCPLGYPLTANGFDAQRQRHKWLCAQACLRNTAPTVRLPETVYPPPACPFQSPAHPHGLVRNIAERFPDGSIRLVRDVPFGSQRWKQLYHRARNAVEGRNAFFEHAGLKRLPVYGELRSRALIFLSRSSKVCSINQAATAAWAWRATSELISRRTDWGVKPAKCLCRAASNSASPLKLRLAEMASLRCHQIFSVGLYLWPA
jgi:hypothetical protein